MHAIKLMLNQAREALLLLAAARKPYSSFLGIFNKSCRTSQLNALVCCTLAL